MQPPDNFKFVVVGSGGVGKSCLTLQFAQNQFIDGHDPTIEDSYQKIVKVDGRACRLDILDTAGQEEFASMRTANMRKGQGFVLVYSITDRSSIEKISELHTQLLRIKGNDGRRIPMVLCGNKNDQEDLRKISDAEGTALASQIGATFFPTSAKTTLNVENAFTELVMLARQFGTAPCECIGACLCYDKCSECSVCRNAHATADHTFQAKKGWWCSIL